MLLTQGPQGSDAQKVQKTGGTAHEMNKMTVIAGLALVAFGGFAYSRVW